MRPVIAPDVAPPLSSLMLDRAEGQLGFKLPQPYVGFLLESNGGQPSPDIVPTPSFPGSPCSDVQRFFGIDAEMECYDLVLSYHVWTRDMPRKLLPIACDSGGSEYCIAVTGDDLGKIYYWDYYRERHSARVRYPWTYLIADSLDAFLESFREMLPEESQPIE